MANSKIPPSTQLIDQQFLNLPGPDGLTIGYRYDEQTRTLYAKESQIIIPPFHGISHVAEDPVPNATTDTSGLLSADDKAKLDAITQLRLGILGFSGAGFSDDGGFLQGDVILASGSEFLSIERIGNVIRFTCFLPGSKVLMPDSTTKSIEELEVGEYVISHTGLPKKIIKTFEHQVSKTIYNINISGHRRNVFNVTGEHPILAVSKITNSRCKKHRVRRCIRCIDRYPTPTWIPAEKLEVGDFVARRYSSNVINDIKEIELANYVERSTVIGESLYSVEHRTHVGNANGTFKIKDPNKQTFVLSGQSIPNKIKTTPEFLKLLGYYLAEGSINYAHNNPTGINFSISEEEAFGEMGADISHCCDVVFGIRPKTYKDKKIGKGFTLRLSCALAARFIKRIIPGNCYAKKIPSWVMELPPEKQRDVVIGFFVGDGWIKHSKRSNLIGMGIAGEQLANQICGLLERCGCTPIVSHRLQFSKQTNKYHDRYKVQVQATDAMWLWDELNGPSISTKRLDFSLRKDGYTLRLIKDITLNQYEGLVHNIEVEDDHSYIVNGVITHNCDAPIPLNCGSEECAQIFWIQDETDVSAIRPPSCGGKVPDVNIYGELKVYQLPESTIVNPSSPTAALNQKDSFPALVFKRADDSVTPGQAEFELVLARNSNQTTNIGWAFTPGATGIPQNVWFMGLDNDGNQIRFGMNIERDPNLLGSLLYKGHTLTRQMAVVTGLTSTVLTDNRYNLKFWSVDQAMTVGDEFTATNVWQYDNPQNLSTALVAPKTLILDATRDLLPVGTLVQIWEFQIGTINGARQVRRFFNQEPKLNPGTLWGLSGSIRFGDLLTSKDEIPGVLPTELTASRSAVNDLRLFERTQWGITGFEDQLYLADDGEITAGTDEGQIVVSDVVDSIDLTEDPDNPTPNFKIVARAALTTPFTTNELADRIFAFRSGLLVDVEFKVVENSASTITLFDPDGRAADAAVDDTFDVFIGTLTDEPSGIAINNQYVADIDPAIPALVVSETPPMSDQERPVFLWHRANHRNVYMKALVGRPDSSRFPPIDILLRAPIDSIDDLYLKVLRRGNIVTGPFRGNEFVVLKGAGIGWKQLPPSGTLRIMTGKWRNQTWNWQFKAAFDRFDDNAVMLIGFSDPFPFDVDFVPELEGTGITDLSGEDAINLTELEDAAATTVPDATTVVQVVHEDYSAPALRLEFSINDNTGAESIQFQAVAGILNMNQPYGLNIADDFSDDFVRDFQTGTKSVSRIMTQDGFITLGSETPTADPVGFRVVDGGTLPVPIEDESEQWNTLEVMYRDSQLWVWWNGLLVPPNPQLSAALPSPLTITTPYFPVTPEIEVGKVGFRLWPGAIVRDVEIRDQLITFNEFIHGQIQLVV